MNDLHDCGASLPEERCGECFVCTLPLPGCPADYDGNLDESARRPSA